MTFVRPNYLNVYWTNLHPIRRYGRTMAVNEKSEVSFWIPQRRGRGNQFSGHLLIARDGDGRRRTNN